MPLDIQTSDVIEWSVTLSMDSGCSATITLADPTDVYTDAALNQQVQLIAGVNGDQTTWFRGIVEAIDPDYDRGVSNVVQLRMSSFFKSLDRKPINTEKYSEVLDYVLVEELLVNYGGMISSLVDTSYTILPSEVNTLSNIMIAEESILLALKQIAKAKRKEIYVDRDGVMKYKKVKVKTDSVDYAFSRTQVIKAKKTRSNEASFSRVRVRGRYLSISEASIEIIFDQLVAFYGDGDTTATADIYVNASPETIANAEISTDTPGITDIQIVDVSQIEEGIVTVEVTNPGGFGVGINTVHVILAGVKIDANEADSFSLQQATNPKIVNLTPEWSVLNLSSRKRIIGSLSSRSNKSADEHEENRIETVVTNTALVSEFGIRWLEIDNPYISTSAECVLVGLRAFTEHRQSKNTWELEVVYRDGVKLNDVITFMKPTIATPTGVITCVVRGIKIRYKAAKSELKMILTVEELPTVVTVLSEGPDGTGGVDSIFVGQYLFNVLDQSMTFVALF